MQLCMLLFRIIKVCSLFRIFFNNQSEVYFGIALVNLGVAITPWLKLIVFFLTKSSRSVLILYIHFINIHFRQHNYIIKA